MKKRLIWDLPTRLFHWLLVTGLVIQYVTATWIDNAMQWHFYTGYFLLGLIIFRLMWGITGPEHARFSSFVTSPVSVFKYSTTLFSRHSHVYGGHNPLGGYVVLTILALVTSQAVSGLFMTDDIFMEGPWFAAASDTVKDVANYLHRTGFNWLLIVSSLHIAAIAFYRLYKKQRLTAAMFHGKKHTEARAVSSSRLWLALILAIISALLTFYIVCELPPEAVSQDVYY